MFQAYIGTYTKQHSQGIYFINISDAGKVTQITPVASIGNPTYLALSTNNEQLYSIAKIDDKGGIASFLVQEDGSLTYLTALTTAVNPPCFIAVNKMNNQLLTANYHTGSIDYYSINNNTPSLNHLSEVKHHGNGPHSRQEQAHAHYANFTPDNRWILTCDLGTDEIITYQVDNQQLVPMQIFHTLAGSGPRHLIVTKQQDYVYIMTELTSQVIACRFDNTTGKLSAPRYYDTLPANFSAINKGSAIRLSPDERFLYISNRGQDAIVIFKVDGLQLTLIDTISTYGQNPRDFNISPDGTIAVATNETSHNLTIYKRSSHNGRLTVTDTEVPVPEPVSIIFK